MKGCKVTAVSTDKIHAAEKPVGKTRESTEPKRTVLFGKVSFIFTGFNRHFYT